jgi:hypothetical protein
VEIEDLYGGKKEKGDIAKKGKRKGEIAISTVTVLGRVFGIARF